MIGAQYADLRGAPVAHWRLDGSLADTAGSSLAVSVETGTERYTLLAPGLKGFYFDGSTNLYRPSHDAALAIAGDITIEYTCALPPPASFTNLIGFGASGETEATNILWRIAYSSSGTVLEHEHGAGTNDTYILADFVANYSLARVAAVRSSNQWSLWVNGEQLGATSVGLSAATGGGSGALRFGFDMGGAGARVIGSVADMMVTARAKEEDEIVDVYNRTLGPIMGTI